MRCLLTSPTSGGNETGHTSPFAWRGQTVEVRDSARSVLRVIELFDNEELPADEKADRLPPMLFADPCAAAFAAAAADGDSLSANFAALVSDALWEVCGLDAGHTREDRCEEPVIDWGEDADRVRASLLAAYGLEWDEVADRMPFAAVCGLLGCLAEYDSQTPLQQAIMYRTCEPPEHVRRDERAMEAWRARERHFEIGAGRGETEGAMAAQSRAMDAMFAAAERAAGGE